MSRPPRRLFLHLSALSDEEYSSYISALKDVIDDERELACASEQELENRVLGVREVRAWMKGRYRDVQEIDKVCAGFIIARSVRGLGTLMCMGLADSSTVLSGSVAKGHDNWWAVPCCAEIGYARAKWW